MLKKVNREYVLPAYMTKNTRKNKKPIGLYLLLFLFIMDTLTAMWLKQAKTFTIVSPVSANPNRLTSIGSSTASAQLRAKTPVLPEPMQNKSQEEIENYIKKVFGNVDGRIMIAIQHDECNPKRADYPKCEKNDEIEYSCGLLQINLRVHADKIIGNTLEEKCEKLKNDPFYSTETAYRIYKDWDSFNPWTTYKTGHYLKNLN